MGKLQLDVAELQDDVAELRTGLGQLQERVARIEGLLDGMRESGFRQAGTAQPAASRAGT